MNQRTKIPAKHVARQNSAQLKAASSLQTKAVTSSVKKPPAAPPAYRPQPVPKVLQQKLATANAGTDKPQQPGRKVPQAPPVYKPNKIPLVLQAKPISPGTLRGSPGGGKSASLARNSKGPSHVPARSIRSLNPGLTQPRYGTIQRMMAPAPAVVYDEDRNQQDIAEGQKNFKTIKKGTAETADTGPAGRFRLHTVEYNSLPPQVQAVIQQIKAGDDPTKLWDNYRDFHSNRGGHLPETDPGPAAALSVKQQNYHQEAQSKDLDKRGFVAQYAEFHVNQSGLGKAFRLLYDYVNDVYYISLTHYNIWSDAGGGERNPFFRVINVP